ncbi:hypothetical protein AKJ09_07663 [Labilithrix luteola]|uniref:Uncharacterized protein n=1 Tax=Labilithrix luteola TaxID=1391654 RepID=A0A0K1Q6F6_9BACT|nr:hypothetical protein [Labilithrix luteola]AKV01000.1 hypothetical protein AKJ09_07663 [Labilithrix luteola]
MLRHDGADHPFFVNAVMTGAASTYRMGAPEVAMVPISTVDVSVH